MPAFELYKRSALALVIVLLVAGGRGPADVDRQTQTRCQGAAPSEQALPRALRSSSLQGKVLVASPAMADETFAGTRIYLLEHDSSGALGIVVNRPMDGHDLPIALHDGGPVGKNVVLFVHSDDYFTPDSTRVEAGVAVTPTTEAIDAVRGGDGPARWLLAWGYAGWAPGQLEGELARGAWHLEDADASVLPLR